MLVWLTAVNWRSLRLLYYLLGHSDQLDALAPTPSSPNLNPILLALWAAGPVSARFGNLAILPALFAGEFPRLPSAPEIQEVSAADLSLQPKATLPRDVYTVLFVG